MQTILLCLWLKEKKKKKQKEFLGLYTHKEVIIREGKKKTAIWSMPKDIKSRMTWKHNQQENHQMLTTRKMNKSSDTTTL
jgi:hypothetical protein